MFEVFLQPWKGITKAKGPLPSFKVYNCVTAVTTVHIHEQEQYIKLYVR